MQLIILDNYARRNVIQIGLSTFLGNLVKRNVIDLLIIEGEGGEYKMLQELGMEGSVTERGVTVCQINIEVGLFVILENSKSDNEKMHNAQEVCVVALLTFF